MNLHELKLQFHITSIEPFTEGWSEDEKFILTAEDGGRYILRLSSIDKAVHKKREVELLNAAAQLGVPVCTAAAHGEFEDDRYFMLLDWIDAEPALIAIPKLSDAEQYRLGVKAGHYLKLIHSIGTEETMNWQQYFNDKIDRKIKLYRDCPVHYDKAERLIDYLNSNRHLISSSHITTHHGDYHLGNMLLGEELYIIDFERHDIGEPWEEFNRIVWCAQSAPAFAAGRIDGYFDGEVPDEFFRRLLIYIASNILSSIAWAVQFGVEQTAVMIRQADEVMEWYDDMQTVVPSFYHTL